MDSIKIIPLGGIGRIGANMTAIEYKDEILIVDAGAAFTEDDVYGSSIIPDISYLRTNKEKIKGILITHGHEDHIGALPHIAGEINAPIYGTFFTIGMVYNKLCEYGLAEKINKRMIWYNDTVRIGQFKVVFIRVNHSVGDSAALAISCDAGTILHTGDFKIDYTPLHGPTTDIPKLAEIGSKGVLAIMCDSTNAEKEGTTPSEQKVAEAIEEIFKANTHKRILLSLFASNIDRIRQVIETSIRYNRKICIEGKSLSNVIKIAKRLDYLEDFKEHLIPSNRLWAHKDSEVTIIMTGSQGEEDSALVRASRGIHERITITPNDCIVLSSRPIPGNEDKVSNMINNLKSLNATVISEGVHVSGHASSEEIKLMYSITRPKYIIPVHGEDNHLEAQRMIAKSMGYTDSSICMADCGDVVSVSEDEIKITGKVPAGDVYISPGMQILKGGRQ